jgi:protein-S-isoprenylcysteine O-methyltransferase Ste14
MNMKNTIPTIFRIALLGLILIIWWIVLNISFSKVANLSLIFGGVLLAYPLVWIGRKILDRHKTVKHAELTTTFVHFGLGFTFGVPIVKALSTYKQWTGWILPIPSEIGLVLVIITGTATALTVLNLALKGLGAPFFIVLSKKLTADWLYAWTRNPMVLAALALLISLGIWFQSLMFLVWSLIFFSPALIFFIKVFEERELEFRFGVSYLEYKSKTPMLWPKKPIK